MLCMYVCIFMYNFCMYVCRYNVCCVIHMYECMYVDCIVYVCRFFLYVWNASTMYVVSSVGIDKITTLQIRTWASTIRFAEVYHLEPLDHFVTPEKGSNRQGLSFVSLLTGWILYTRMGIHSQIYVYECMYVQCIVDVLCIVHVCVYKCMYVCIQARIQNFTQRG